MTTNTLKFNGLFLIGLILFLVACGNAQPTVSPATPIVSNETPVDEQPAATPIVSDTTDTGADLANADPAIDSYPVDPITGYPIVNNAILATLTPIPPQEVFPPQPGTGNLTGIVRSSITGLPILNAPVQLAEIYREGDQGAFVIDSSSSPFAELDVNGRFVFQDVIPAEYLIVVGIVENDAYEIVTQDDGAGQPFFVEADQTIDIGEVRVPDVEGYETTP